MPSGPVFECEKSIFFVMDEDYSTNDAGGCTQAWWDGQCPNGTEAEKAAAMAKLFDDVDDATPLMEAYNCAYDASENEIILPGAAAAGVEVGMVAHIRESVTPDEYIETGRYRITYVGSGYIQCADIDDGGTNTVVDVVIGGAFEFLQDALDETDASNNSVTIHVQSQGTFVSTTIDIDVGGGDKTKNTFKKIVGFNTSPGDMNYGGTYYQSPLEILQAGSIDNTKTLLFDGNDDDNTIFEIDQNNIILENFHCYNSGNAVAITFTGTPQNIVFRNCRFSYSNFVFASAADSVLVDSCFATNLTGNHYQLSGDSNIVLNCVSDISAGKIFVVVATVEGSQVIGCIAVGGARGIRVFTCNIIAANNTFYNQTSYGIDLTGAQAGIAFNNIFDLASGAVGLYVEAAGSYSYNDYNCFIESDGTPLTVGGNGSGYEVPVKGSHSVQVDPDFVDAANGDFRVRNPLVLRGGRPGSNGKATVIGAIGQEYRFAERGRMMNPGRMTILR